MIRNATHYSPVLIYDLGDGTPEAMVAGEHLGNSNGSGPYFSDYVNI